MNYQKRISELDAVEIYKLKLEGHISRFPYGFLRSKDNCIKIIKYLIEEKLQWSDQEICSNLSNYTFKQYNLYGMLVTIFNCSPYDAINTAYPGRFKPWQIHCPVSYWNVDTAKEAIKWMIEEKLKWSDEDICSKLTKQTFLDNGLTSVLISIFDNSPYKAINATYPGKFKPWQIINCPRNYWNIDTAKDAIKWMIEEKLKWSDEDICSKLCAKTFKDNDLLTPLNNFFDNSPYKAIDAVYPGKFVKKDRKIVKA